MVEQIDIDKLAFRLKGFSKRIPGRMKTRIPSRVVGGEDDTVRAAKRRRAQDPAGRDTRVGASDSSECFGAYQTASGINKNDICLARAASKPGFLEVLSDLPGGPKLGPFKPSAIGLLAAWCIGFDDRPDRGELQADNIEDCGGYLTCRKRKKPVDQTVELVRTKCGQSGFQSCSTPNLSTRRR